MVDAFSPRWLVVSIAVFYNMVQSKSAQHCNVLSKINDGTPKLSKALVNAGVLIPLCTLLGSKNLDIVKRVVATLAIFVGDEELRDRVIEENVLPMLLDLISESKSMVTYLLHF